MADSDEKRLDSNRASYAARVARDPAYGRRRMAENSVRHRMKMASDPEYAARVREDARIRVQIARLSDPKRRERDRVYAEMRRRRDPSINEKLRVSTNEARQKDVVKFLVRAARTRSIKQGRQFDLTYEWAKSRWTGKCELTGIPFDWTKPMLHAFSPSIDRIDPAQGYVQHNCRFILQSLNAFKGASTDEEMLLIAQALVRRGS